MCGLCGFLGYGSEPIPDLHHLTNSLMESSADRGTDASGIAFCDGGRVNILKEGKSAYRVNFKPPVKTRALIGHTRHSTQGSEKKNYNNHPFYGKNAKFALAHNGVLIEEKEIQKIHKLPKTKVETDSFIAVQLIEKKGVLNHDSMKFMAETITGSFSFSILDDQNNIHLIKADSPLSILHFPELKLFCYASTEAILWRALIESKLFGALKAGAFEEIPINEGDILTITNKGELIHSQFEYHDYVYSSRYDWRSYGGYGSYFADDYEGGYSDTYLSDLKSVAASFGVSPDEVDVLLAEGFTPEEIEEYLYECDYGEV